MKVLGVLIATLLPMAMVAPGAGADPGQEPLAGVPYRILPLGDSITQGTGEASLNGYRNYLRETTGVQGLNPDYVGICPQPTAPEWKCAQSPTMPDKQHAGHSGWRSDEIAARVPYFMAWYDPQAVLLMAGANDIAQNWDLANYAKRMGGIVDTILAKRPGTHVFVATMTQFRDQRPIVNQLNNDLVAMVGTKNSAFVHLVPQHIVGDEPDKELSDHVHPNACGYARIAYVWWYYLEPVYSPGRDWPDEPNPFYDTSGAC